jgi:hypothetical protein
MNNINNSQSEIVAYKLKSEEFFEIASSYLWPIQKKKRKPEEWPSRGFAKGSCVYTIMLDADVLDLYYEPIYNTYKVLSFDKVKQLENSIAMFSSGFHQENLENRTWEMVDHNGNKHVHSEAFTLAVQEVKKNLKIIKDILYE